MKHTICHFSFMLIWLSLPAYAQTTAPITSSGLNTVVTTNGTVHDITGGTRAGTNLFHSFGEFNVPTANIANFQNTQVNGVFPETSNILSRVTGGNPSNIFGTIQTTNFGSANLFLMNPAGIVFGPNATLNVGGSVHFTTADYLKLADGAVFNAVPNLAADGLLTTAPVAAFGFLGSNPAAITVQGSQLAVAEGKAISLIGGDITVQSGTLGDGTVQAAHLSAPAGQINVVSVASPGEILYPSFSSATNVNAQSFTSMGNITLSEGSLLDVSANTAGTVRIRGGQLLIVDATISADTNDVSGAPTAVDIKLTGDMSISDTRGVSAITAQTTGAGDAGDVEISSLNLTAITTSDSALPGNLIDTHTSGTGRAGSVTIDTGTLRASSANPLFNFIETGTTAEGNGGNVTIVANNVQLQNTAIDTGDGFARALFQEASGSAGNLEITATTLQLNNAQLIADAFSAFADSQQAGNITLNVNDINMTTGVVSAIGVNRGGAITINADQLVTDFTIIESDTLLNTGGGVTVNARVVELTNGSTLVSSTYGDGNAGDINVTGTDHVSLIGHAEGQNPLGLTQPTGLYSNSFGFFGSAGNSGNIFVTTPKLLMTGGSRITAATASSGNGGNVTINAGTISISGEFPSPGALEGTIWDIQPLAPSGIFAVTVGSESCTGLCGNAGTISIAANSLDLGSGAQINSSTNNTGQGGNVIISAANTISLSGTLSDGSPVGIFSKSVGAEPDAGAGGNITLTAGQSVTITDGAAVSASTSGPGNAGTIAIQADALTLDGFGQILANADVGSQGHGGNIDVQVREGFLGGGSTIATNTLGPGDAGNISLQASERLTLTGFSGITTSAFDLGSGAGNAGAIRLTAPTLELNGGVIISLSQGPGNAGNIILEAENVTAGEGSFLSSETLGPGQGGNISIHGVGGPGSRASDVTFSGGTTVTSSTSGDGQAGTITVQAERIVLTDSLLNTSTVAAGAAGNIMINASESLQVASFSSLESTSRVGSTGKAGDITITTPTATIEQGGFISTSTSGTGNAGNITVNTDSLNLLSGGQLTSSSTIDLAPDAPPPSGAAGMVTVQGFAGPAQTILIDGAGSGIFTVTQGSGAGGNISIAAAQSVTLSNGAAITASSTGTGDAGNIKINAGQQLTMRDSSIITEAAQAAGGNIDIQAIQQVQLDNSTISTSVLGGSGGGGNITIDPVVISLQNNSSILAQAVFGNGGNILLNTNLLLVDPSSVISASSQFGQSGTIQSPTSNLAGTVGSLPSSLNKQQALQAQRCAVLAEQGSSSFVIAGREMLPTEPGGWLTSPYAALQAGKGQGARGDGLDDEG
ncbi:beta strand repeat-containing protein, partial [Petrachloros mirabilis]